ncbi:hypothetical protein MCG45_02245 [Clostridium perfringens]|uniref:hypothetical protein n=1 Tax=Clostridium perfringens TaxID=1502 RepID=UPI001F059C34|nr:hypothetical protein [Clostridium perfringens]MCH1961686.1 hypothetical protein [Clostridium perfringens]
MVKNFKKTIWLLVGVMVFGIIGMVGCTKKTDEMTKNSELSATTPAEYKTMLEEKIKTYIGDVNLGTEYDFSKVTEDTKQETYKEYEKYYKNLDTELTNLKNELNSKVSPSDGKVNDANRKIVESIDNLKMSISTVKSDLDANRNKILAMPKDEFIGAMKDIEKSAYDARVKVQESIDAAKNSFK